MEHKHFYTFAVMLFYIQMEAGSSKKQCNNDAIRELIQTLDDNASLDAIDAPTKMAQPFTAIQLTDKHVRFCDFLDLCQEICKKEKPEVVTIITVKKYYDDENDTSGDSFMPTFISAIKNYFVNGNESDVCNNPSIVTVHTVDDTLLCEFDKTDLNHAVFTLLNKHLNTLSIEYVDKIFADFMYKCIVSEVKRCIIFASHLFFTSKTENDYTSLVPDAKSPYKIFTERIKNVYIHKKYNDRIEKLYNDCKNNDQSYHMLLEQIQDYVKKLISKIDVPVSLNSNIDFSKLLDAKFKFAMCRVYFDIKQQLFSSALKYDYCADLSSLMSGTFDILAQKLQSEYDKNFKLLDIEDILLDCLDNQCDQEQLSMFYKELFGNHDIKAIISDEVAKSDLLTKTKLNNDLYTANSTKIILNKELSREMLPSLCQALQEIKIFERFDMQQNVYINFDKPDDNFIRDTTHLLETKGELRTITDPSNLFENQKPYEYIITSLNTHDNENIISRVPLHLSFDSDAKIKRRKIDTSSISLLQNTSNNRVVKFGVNDYHGSISQQAIYYIDNAILIKNREIVGVYKISKRNDLSGTNGEEIVIIHHRNIEGQNDEKVSIIYETEIEKSHKQIDTYGETTRKFKCFHNVPVSLLISVKEQAELLRLTSVRITIPNHFESDDTDYYYRTVAFNLKRKCHVGTSFINFNRSFLEVKENVDYYSVNTNEFFGHINWTHDLASFHSVKSYRFMKLEELRYIVDKCLIKECSKYGMVNAANIFCRKQFEEQWIYIFFVKLDEQRTIVNFYKEQDVIIKHANKFKTAERILYRIYNDKNIRVADACLRRLRPLEEFNRKNMLILISDVLCKFRRSPKFITSKQVYSFIEKKIQEMFEKSFIDESSTGELETPVIYQLESLEYLALVQVTKRFIDDMTRRIMKVIDEHYDYVDVILTTVVLNRKIQDSETAAPTFVNNNLQPTDEILELLEEHFSRFVTAIKSDPASWKRN